MANKIKPRVFFPVVDEAIAAYQRRTGRTQENIASSLNMAPNTFASKRKGEGEFTFTEMVHVCSLLNLTLDEAAQDAVITYPDETRTVLA